jgi:hypothetical protein
MFHVIKLGDSYLTFSGDWSSRQADAQRFASRDAAKLAMQAVSPRVVNVRPRAVNVDTDFLD